MSAGGRLDDLDELVAEDIVGHAPVPPGTPPGRAGLKALTASYRQAFPDLCVTAARYLEQGDTGCAVVRMTGTHTAPLMGIAPTGTRFDISAIDVVRVVDGRAVEHWGASDDLGMLAQLGAVALPGAPAVPAQGTTIDLGDKVQA